MSVPETTAERTWRFSRSSAEGRRARFRGEGFRVDIDQTPNARGADRLDSPAGGAATTRALGRAPAILRPFSRIGGPARVLERIRKIVATRTTGTLLIPLKDVRCSGIRRLSPIEVRGYSRRADETPLRNPHHEAPVHQPAS